MKTVCDSMPLSFSREIKLSQFDYGCIENFLTDNWICTRFSFSNVVIFSFDSCALQRRSWSLRNLCPHRHGFESALQRLQRNWHRGHPWARSRSTGWNGPEPTTIWVLFNGRRRGSPCHPQGLTPAASAESPSSLPTAVDSRLVIEIVMSTVWLVVQ